MQNRLSVAEPRLPRDVVQNGIVVAKANADFLMVVALKSSDPAIDSNALDNLITAQVLDPIRRLPGVGGATQFGCRLCDAHLARSRQAARLSV